MKKILVTGSSGFVGKYLTLYCKENGLETVALNLRAGSLSYIDPEIDAIVHLAGKAHDLKNVSYAYEYFEVNTELTKKIFEQFLLSNSSVFIFMSSVKALADTVDGILTEESEAHPLTVYGQSKLQAETYLLSQKIPKGKRIYIFRPCMIHGPGNKGNLNLLYKIVSKSVPWPLGAYENKRSFCSIENLCFVIKELIEREEIPSGIYNVADDVPLSTNELISILAESQNRQPNIWKISKKFIQFVAKIGDVLKLPLNTERLNKLTETYIVSNTKILKAINKPLPLSSKEGLIKTFSSFK